MGLISLDVPLSSECQAPALHDKHFTVHALYGEQRVVCVFKQLKRNTKK